jgi:hypothetical protein
LVAGPLPIGTAGRAFDAGGRPADAGAFRRITARSRRLTRIETAVSNFFRLLPAVLRASSVIDAFVVGAPSLPLADVVAGRRRLAVPEAALEELPGDLAALRLHIDPVRRKVQTRLTDALVKDPAGLEATDVSAGGRIRLLAFPEAALEELASEPPTAFFQVHITEPIARAHALVEDGTSSARADVLADGRIRLFALLEAVVVEAAGSSGTLLLVAACFQTLAEDVTCLAATGVFAGGRARVALNEAVLEEVPGTTLTLLRVIAVFDAQVVVRASSAPADLLTGRRIRLFA